MVGEDRAHATAPRRLSLCGRQGAIAGLEWDHEAGAPALALHGWLDNAATFHALAPRLTDLDITAIDLPGHGLSDHWPWQATSSFIDWLPEVVHLLRQMNVAPVTLLGHSMGAGVAMLVAATFGELVERLILIDGLVPLVAAPEEAPSRLRQYIEAVLEAKRRPLTRYGSVEEALAARVKAGEFAVPEAMRPVVERNLCPQNGGLVWRTDVRLRQTSAQRLTEAQVRAYLDRVSCPTLIVRPRNGLRGLPIEQLAEHLTSGEIVEVDGYHHVHLDDPGVVATVITRFIADRRHQGS